MLSGILSCKGRHADFIERRIDAPAVCYAVVSKDSVLHEYLRGSLKVGDDRAVYDTAQFALFSITKTFTAMAVLQLQEQGRLELDDKVSDYLPNYAFLRDITIRQLLCHQSGLNNPLPLKWIHLAEEDETFDYRGFSSEVLQTKARIQGPPGKKASYSNLNYLLLGEVIERISGQDYKAYIRANVLTDNTGIGFTWDQRAAVTGYHHTGLSGWFLGMLLDKKKFTGPNEGKLIPFKTVYLNGTAYGGLIASAKGLNRFLQRFLTPGNRILSESAMRQMFTEQPLASGRLSGHALGWFTGVLDGHAYVHHAGGGGGFYAELRIYPGLNLASYLLTNISGFSDKRILDKVDATYLRNEVVE